MKGTITYVTLFLFLSYPISLHCQPSETKLVKTSDVSKYELSLNDYDGGLDSHIRFIPNFVKGKISGVRVMSVKPISFWSDITLVRGDIIANIDGVALTSMNIITNLMKGVGKKGEHLIGIVKNGELRVIEFTLK